MAIQDKSANAPASAADVPKRAASAVAPPEFVRVRATRPGFCPSRESGMDLEGKGGRHYYREKDDIFTIPVSKFTDEWMVKADGDQEPPALAPEPPPTTLPTRPKPVTLS